MRPIAKKLKSPLSIAALAAFILISASLLPVHNSDGLNVWQLWAGNNSVKVNEDPALLLKQIAVIAL